MTKNVNQFTGNLVLCKKCEEISCCKTQVGGLIEAPFLTQYDIDTIVFSNKFSSLNDFAMQRIHPFTGERFYTLQTNPENDRCKFFKNDRCEIYDIRPLDCRIFPLDIVVQEDKYMGILYKLCYEFCGKQYNIFKTTELNGLLEYAEVNMLPYLMLPYSRDSVKSYAAFKNGITRPYEYEILKEVSLKF